MDSEHGEKSVHQCAANCQVITNNWLEFKEYAKRFWTCKWPERVIKSQIDYLINKRRFRNVILHSKIYPNADCGRDHLQLIYNYIKKNR